MPSILRLMSPVLAMVPAGVLCVDHTADAERGDEHGDCHQFLYHLGVLLQRLVRSGNSAYITDQDVRQKRGSRRAPQIAPKGFPAEKSDALIRPTRGGSPSPAAYDV
jgi:hypothetical protein